MPVDNPTMSTQPWEEEEFQEEERPRHHRRSHHRWGKIVFPIIGLIVIGVLIKKCCNRRRRWHERVRQQMMQNVNAQAIVPVQRSLPDQLAYHRQEAQRIEMMLQQQNQQYQMHQALNEPSFEPVYGHPIQPRY
jgi:hypothetical protein